MLRNTQGVHIKKEFRLCGMEKIMTGLISVIIPIHNTEQYLEQCIDSILDQTYTNWELLLIDDESTDGCEKICRNYASVHPDKISYYKKKHGGLSAARNFGIERAKGEYLYFLDSDDYCEKNLLAKTCEQADSQNADMVAFGYVIHRGQHTQTFQYGKSGRITQEEFFDSILQDDKIGNYICTKLFRRDLFETIRFPEGELFEDVSTAYKLILKSKRILVLDECFYHYMKREDSLTETLDETGIMHLYRSMKMRNQTIVERFPNLREKSVRSELKYLIFIWNQLVKRYDSQKCRQYYFIVQEMRAQKGALKRLSVRDHVLGSFICWMPMWYARIFHVLKGKKYV